MYTSPPSSEATLVTMDMSSLVLTHNDVTLLFLVLQGGCSSSLGGGSEGEGCDGGRHARLGTVVKAVLNEETPLEYEPVGCDSRSSPQSPGAPIIRNGTMGLEATKLEDLAENGSLFSPKRRRSESELSYNGADSSEEARALKRTPVVLLTTDASMDAILSAETLSALHGDTPRPPHPSDLFLTFGAKPLPQVSGSSTPLPLSNTIIPSTKINAPSVVVVNLSFTALSSQGVSLLASYLAAPHIVSLMVLDL
jgi:hypothetical protein